VGFRARGFEAKEFSNGDKAPGGLPLGDKNCPQLIDHAVILRQRLE